MRYKSEIFDHMQYLYHITGFNDHQVHCIIKFDNKLNVGVLEKAVGQLIKTIPILSRAYREDDGRFFWKDTAEAGKAVLSIVYTKEDFEHFTVCARIDEKSGPQIKVCLLQSQKDSLAVVINHMVADGAGLKQCVYLLSGLYSNIMKKSDYNADFIIDGDRGFKNILAGIPIRDRLKILLFQNKENNQSTKDVFPMASEKSIAPFLLKYEISQDRFFRIHNYCKEHDVTINDFLLTAYFRVLSKQLGKEGKVLSIPIMIDMRRYLQVKDFNALTNLSSTVIIRAAVFPGESFQQTLTRINQETSLKKEHFLGLNTFIKLDMLYRILGKRLSYKVLAKALKNPKICMTNIGVLNSNLLHFEGASIENAFVFGAIKYRPHFQLAVSSFNNTMTFCVNLNGSRQDQDNMKQFLNCLEKEINHFLS